MSKDRFCFTLLFTRFTLILEKVLHGHFTHFTSIKGRAGHGFTQSFTQLHAPQLHGPLHAQLHALHVDQGTRRSQLHARFTLSFTRPPSPTEREGVAPTTGTPRPPRRRHLLRRARASRDPASPLGERSLTGRPRPNPTPTPTTARKEPRMTIPPVPLTNTQPAPIALPARWECSHGPTDDEAYCLEAEDDSHVCPTIRVHPDDAEQFAALVDEANRLRAREVLRKVADMADPEAPEVSFFGGMIGPAVAAWLRMIGDDPETVERLAAPAAGGAGE